jgi:hypothetical protein
MSTWTEHEHLAVGNTLLLTRHPERAMIMASSDRAVRPGLDPPRALAQGSQHGHGGGPDHRGEH